MALQAGDQILESRILHLPMAFDDKWTRECISRYMRSARQEAPYLPSNIDFVAKNNGKAPLAPSCLNQTDTCQSCSSMHIVAPLAPSCLNQTDTCQCCSSMHTVAGDT